MNRTVYLSHLLDLNPGSFDSLIADATRTRFEQAYASAVRLGADR